MKTKPNAKNAPATQSELARRLGVSRQAISVHASKPDAPPIHDVEKWEIYLASVGRSGSLPADLRRKIGEQRLAILMATRESLERENKRAAGQLTSNEEIIRGLNQIGNAFFGTLKGIFAAAPRELEQVTKEEVFRWCEKSYGRICKLVEAEFDKLRKIEPKSE